MERGQQPPPEEPGTSAWTVSLVASFLTGGEVRGAYVTDREGSASARPARAGPEFETGTRRLHLFRSIMLRRAIRRTLPAFTGILPAVLALLLCLPAAAQDDPAVLFQRGMAAAGQAGFAMDAGQRDALLDEAADSFHVMLVQDPDLERPRLELARILFLQGKDRLAKEHFERVLASDPPPPVVANINRFLSEIRARRRWSAHFGFALAPDSNIGAGSDERFVNIYGLPFRRDQEELISSGVGVKVWAGGEYQHPLGEKLRLRLGGNVSRTEYKESRFDKMNLSAHVGPRWLVGPRTELSVLTTASHRWTADDPEYLDLGLRIEGRHRLSQRTTANLRASWIERRHDSDDMLNGPVTDLSLGASHVLTPTLRADAMIGWARERPERARARSKGRRVNAGLTALLPRGFTVGGNVGLGWTDWEGDWFPYITDGQSREDRTRSLRLSVHHRGLTVSGFSPELSLKREERTSNAQLHDYDRTSGELSFVRPF